MAIGATTASVQELPRGWLEAVLRPSGLTVLRDRLARALYTVIGSDDQLLHRVVVESIGAFIDQNACSASAARQVAPLLWELGDRHARRGGGQRELDVSFTYIQKAALDSLQFVINSEATGGGPRQLRIALMAFVQRLRLHALIGWERRLSVDIPSPRAVTASDVAGVRSVLEKPSDPSRLAILAETHGIGADAPYRAVVACQGTVGRRLLTHPEALTGDDLQEVLIPAAWTAEHIEDLLECQAVVGPPVPLSQIGESAELTTRVAGLLRDRVASHPAMAVPCTDLIGALTVEGSPLLTRLVIQEYLDPLAKLSVRRRADLGEILLQRLLTDSSLAEVARLAKASA